MKNLFGLSTGGYYARIDAAGGWKTPPIQMLAAPLSFYGHIRFSGVLEPMSGKPGLGFIPHTVLYCETEMTYLEALAHYKSHPGLHVYSALFLEKHSRLACMDGAFQVEGREGDPGMVIMQPKAAADPSFNVTILIPGARFKIAETHFEILPS